jgi:hypothetical protein
MTQIRIPTFAALALLGFCIDANGSGTVPGFGPVA